MSTTPDPNDLQAGRDASYLRRPAVPPPEIADRSAYAQGYAEGRDVSAAPMSGGNAIQITVQSLRGAVS
jgi:hypothetical protein